MTYCNEPPGVMEQESEYFALLKNASFYGVNGEDMVLSDDGGKNGLIFKRVFFWYPGNFLSMFQEQILKNKNTE